MRFKVQASALALGVALYSPIAAAQETGDAAAPAASEAAAPGARKLIYTPSDFARFAPKTAYDMLVQVPSFTIREADRERGLGQASENVLINGQRIANKTGGAIDELRRIGAANVERIEIVDASSLGIAGLAGQVANVITAEQKASSGQFEWNPDVRAHYAKPNLLQGSISYTSELGPVEYTLSARNDAGRGAFGGPGPACGPGPGALRHAAAAGDAANLGDFGGGDRLFVRDDRERLERLDRQLARRPLVKELSHPFVQFRARDDLVSTGDFDELEPSGPFVVRLHRGKCLVDIFARFGVEQLVQRLGCHRFRRREDQGFNNGLEVIGHGSYSSMGSAGSSIRAAGSPLRPAD